MNNIDLYDVVDVNGKTCIVIDIVKDFLVVYDLVNLGVFKVTPLICKLVVSSSKIPIKPINELSEITSPSKLYDLLTGADWNMTDVRSSFYKDVLKDIIVTAEMSQLKQLEIYDQLITAKSLPNTQVTISGTINDGMVINLKLSVGNNDGKLAINDIRRIFGDQAVFGDVKHSKAFSFKRSAFNGWAHTGIV